MTGPAGLVAKRAAVERAAQKPPPAPIHIYLYGKYQDPTFQLLKAAAEHLATEHQSVKATVEAFFDTQYEQHLRHVVANYGGNFAQAKASAPLAFIEAEDKILYFATDKLLLEWLQVHYKYEDTTSFLLYKRMGVKALQAAKEQSGRSCCGFTIQVGDEAKETVQFQLFDEAAPELAQNFLKLLSNPKFDGNPVHRVKAGCWIQAGDLVDGSGRNSDAADGGFLRHESFTVPHDRPGLLGMCCHGKDTIGSQFYITLRDLPFLDGKFCVIGRVISGMRTIIRIGKMATKNERPEQAVKLFADPSLTMAAKGER
mmetsp:Transcript_95915/g.117553  ORF Transcript_95915/g.117553 Transcript_95915/m.117553 type:complete len:313 (-) Transcript_95915:119-1057(-)